MKSQADIARELAPILDRNLRSVTVFLNNIIRGKKKLPRVWEPHLLKAVGCSTLAGLKEMYPQIELHDEKYEVELVVRDPIGSVPVSRLPDVLKVLNTLRLYGLNAEITIRTKHVDE